MAGLEDVLAAKFRLILPHLDERQRRLLLGVEADALGRGGVRVVARAAGVREATVSAGVKEIAAGAVVSQRVRRPGGGRKRLVEVDPGLRAALLGLVEPEERGDPMSPLRWTTKSLRALAEELTRQGHRIGRDSVAALLHAEGFSLQGNAKTLEGQRHPDRNAQFEYLNAQVKAFQSGGDPVISVDSKKKEQLGDYANPGRTWRPAGDPARTLSHDFPDPEGGIAIPYGIYDLGADTGWVNVGTDHNTAAFAVESIRRWWAGTGRHDYPAAHRLLITADAGGSNGYRTRTWKAALAALALETGLEITVCHFPPGTSKWNKIEHRLFSHITMNWKGRPLTSHDVVVQSIAATTTRTGLTVHAELDTASYPLAVQIGDALWAALPMTGHDWHPEWNYTLHPRPADLAPPQPFDQPRHDLAWLTHPALTGVPDHDWDQLIAALTAQHEAHAQAGRLPGRPFRRDPHQRRDFLTLADRLTATLIYHQHGIPQTVLAPIYGIRTDSLNKLIVETRHLLHQAGHTLPKPRIHRGATPDDLHTIAQDNRATTDAC
jgi:transposase